MSNRGFYSIFSMFIIAIVSAMFISSAKIEKENTQELVTSTEMKSVASGTEDEEEVIHTHIWATKYDKDKHWEYCTVCDRIKNEEVHSFTDNWFWGYPTCHVHGDNYSTRICKCGYSYIYRMPHGNVKGWYNTGVRMVHYKLCADCGNWITSGYCYDDEGRLGCTNPGTCKVCGITATKDWHWLHGATDKATGRKGIECIHCKKRFVDIKDYSLTYTKDYSAAIIEFTYVPLDSSVGFPGTTGAYCGNWNYNDEKWTLDRYADGSVRYKGVYTFDIEKQRKSTLCFHDRIGVVSVNGVKLYTEADVMSEVIWQDHEAPIVDRVKQVNQATSGEWATIKELTIEGRENLSKIVTISIKDKQTGEIIIDKAKTNVVNGKYTYQCTPAIEGPAEGRDYIVEVSDQIGNTLEHTFTIYRTDSRAPLLRESEFTEWSKTKFLNIPITDYGSGLVQTSLDNQYSYKHALWLNDVYNGFYVFSEENYGVDEHTIYLKDGLGNARREKINVGKVDNTKPHIKKVSSDKDSRGVDVKIEGDDYSSELKAQGSGVVEYAVTTSTKSNPNSWSTSNVIRLTDEGKYYIWVKDKAGNIGDARQIEVLPNYDIVVPEEDVTIDNKNSNIMLNGEKYLYAYYTFNEDSMSSEYRKTTELCFNVYGIKNNDERMYMYLSTSPTSKWTSIKNGHIIIDSLKILSAVNSDPNLIRWPMRNSREIFRDNSIYMIQGNNQSILSPSVDIENFLGNKSDKKNIYLHVITETGMEYVTKTAVVKREIFDQH